MPAGIVCLGIVERDLLPDRLRRAAENNHDFVHTGGAQMIQDGCKQSLLTDLEQLFDASHASGHARGEHNC